MLIGGALIFFFLKIGQGFALVDGVGFVIGPSTYSQTTRFGTGKRLHVHNNIVAAGNIDKLDLKRKQELQVQKRRIN